MSARQNELEETERPFCRQLEAMGWEWIECDRSSTAAHTGRSNFSEVLLEDRLRSAIRRINVGVDGEPWLDDERIGQAVSDLRRLPSANVMEANRRVDRLLHEGTQVEPWPEKTGHTGEATVRYVDFDDPGNNDLLAVSQVRVDRPGSLDSLFPDIVLFVNGIPMVVVECKASSAGAEPVGDAMTDLFGYEGRIEGKTGLPRLFFYNQFMVATAYEDAVAGCIGARPRFFLQWKDVWPADEEQVRRETGADHLTPQHKLVAGMLRPANLVDIVRNFALFDDSAGTTAKIVARYQQFRAVQMAILRLQSEPGSTRGGIGDERSGIIWHTQGSGKSLTMVFLVRKMRRILRLRRYKVVVVTDRKALQRQLRQTAKLTNQPVEVAENTAELKKLLRKPGQGLVFAMIQKYQERDEADLDKKFPELNDSEEILVLVDEAHRSQSQTLHANLLRALPNCARIGFTGTPILEGDKMRTHEIFGPYIDKYTIEQSVEDGATLPIYYEGRYQHWGTVDDATLDMHFDAAFKHLTEEERDEIRRRHVTRSAVSGAERLIEAKARDMLRHYVDVVMPNGFKAQVVASGRDAAVRYRDGLEKARDELLEEIAEADDALTELGPDELEDLPDPTRQLANAIRHRETIESLEFACTISADHKNDPDHWKQWSSAGRISDYVSRFKKPLYDPESRDGEGLAFLCVDSMLLTGFDAPVEQVMYIDRRLRRHNLLQAIARTNRRYEGKEHGLIVDYWGLADELNDALRVYSQSDIEGAWTDIGDELPRLDDRHHRVVTLFTSAGLDLDDTEGCVQHLEDVETRAKFLMYYRDFLSSLDIVMPRPEALDYQRDAGKLAAINDKAGKRYRDDEQRRLFGASDKVRELLDAYIRSEGIEPRIEPVSIMDTDFEDHLEREPSTRAKASEMEHAMRHHIDVHFDEDPVRYEALSERLDEIRENNEGRWERLYEQLEKLRDELHNPPEDPDDTGLDPRRELPFYRVLKQKLERTDTGDGAYEYEEVLVEYTETVVDLIAREISRVDFWKSKHYQNQLRNKVARELLRAGAVGDTGAAQALADRLVDLARSNHDRLVGESRN